MEGTLKYVYMMQGEPHELRQKVAEYWETLPGFSSMKTSDRVERFLAEVPEPKSLEWKSLRDLVLTEDEKADMKQDFSRKQRSILEQKWSFSGIIKELFMSGRDDLKLFIHSAAYGYGSSSHLIHKDGDGVGMVWERCTRDAERQMAVKLGHSARIVSDVCVFAKIRLLYLLKACQEETAYITHIDERYRWLNEELNKAASRFNQIEYGDKG
ncbi:MAG: hypothetical protein C4534_09330 [Gaiellales bacterium]|nr:MAG: hypothetical protein C4534_09330 [Gaiellales bacterium]